MDPKATVAKNTLIRSGAQLFNMLLSAAFLMYITRKLGSSDFGKYTLAFSLANLIFITTEMGFHTFLVAEIAKRKESNGRTYGAVLLIKLLLSIFSILALSLVAHLSSYPGDLSLCIFIMGIFVLGTSFLEMFNATFRGFEKMEYEAAAMSFNRIMVIGAGMLTLYFGYGLKAFVISITLGNLVTVLPVMSISLRRFIMPELRFDKELIKSVFRQAWPLGLVTLLTTVMMKSGIVILSIFEDPIKVGWYGAPLRLIESLMVFPFFFSFALLPIFTSLYVSDKKGLIKWYECSLKIVISFGLPAALIVTVLADKISLGLFGRDFVHSAVILQFLIWSALFGSLNSILGSLLISIDKTRDNTKCYIAGSVLTVISGLILIPIVGYSGAGVSILMGQIIAFSKAINSAERNLAKARYFSLCKKPLFGGLIVSAIIFFLRDFGIIPLAFLSLLLYLICLFTVGVSRMDDIVALARSIKIRQTI